MNLEQAVLQQGIRIATIKSQDKEKEYQLKLLPATLGWKVAQQLLQLVLPSAGAGIDGLRSQDASLLEENKTFRGMAETLICQMDKIDVAQLILVILKDVVVDGKKIDFDTYYMGNYGEMLLAIEFSLKENFTSFFTDEGLRTRILDHLTGLIPNQ